MLRRAGVLLSVLVLSSGAGATVGAGPASAGGWAVTVVDEVPGGVTSGKAYDVSFWVLQHGTHPYNWTQPSHVGRVGIEMTDAGGRTVFFEGRALTEPAHYATTITVPGDGEWRVVGVQGVFGDFHVGSWRVPGTLTALGVPAAPSAADLQRHWPGDVRPPVLPIDEKRDPFGTARRPGMTVAPPAVASSAAAPANAGATASSGSDSALPLPAAAVVGGALLLVVLLGAAVGAAVGARRRSTRRNGVPA